MHLRGVAEKTPSCAWSAELHGTCLAETQHAAYAFRHVMHNGMKRAKPIMFGRVKLDGVFGIEHDQRATLFSRRCEPSELRVERDLYEVFRGRRK